jgi:hypothetical protein
MRYRDLGADYYERQRDIRRQIACHVGKLGALGFEVTLSRPEPLPHETGTTQAAWPLPQREDPGRSAQAGVRYRLPSSGHVVPGQSGAVGKVRAASR